MAVVLWGVLSMSDRAMAPVQASSRTNREAGAVLFHERGCEHCHGVDGIGTDKGPDLSTIGKRWTPAKIEQQIRWGGNGMPPFGEALQPDEVKLLVDYLKAKKKAPKQTKPPPQEKQTQQPAS